MNLASTWNSTLWTHKVSHWVVHQTSLSWTSSNQSYSLPKPEANRWLRKSRKRLNFRDSSQTVQRRKTWKRQVHPLKQPPMLQLVAISCFQSSSQCRLSPCGILTIRCRSWSSCLKLLSGQRTQKWLLRLFKRQHPSASYSSLSLISLKTKHNLAFSTGS